VKNHNRILPTLAAAALLATPVAAFAQDTDQNAMDTPPSATDTQPAAMSVPPDSSIVATDPNLVTVTGTVVSADAGQLQLQSGQTIFLNDGTTVTPDLTSFEGGLPRVSITGYLSTADGSSINATEIDPAS
jgi:hypothetical protein